MLSLNQVPCLQEGVLLEDKEGIHYLYHSVNNEYVLLDNDTSRFIIELCEGDCSIQNILEQLDQHFINVDKTTALSDLNLILSDLSNAGFIYFK